MGEGFRKTKVFISVPMNGRKEEEIRKDILDAEEKYLEHSGKKREDVWFYNNLDGVKRAVDFEYELAESNGANVILPEDDTFHLWCLGIAFNNLAYSDEAVFYGNWMRHRGCVFEYEACKEYKIPVICIEQKEG